ncbi:MAG: HAMP domain-containing protein, partial [Pseudomonadota bacterium]
MLRKLFRKSKIGPFNNYIIGLLVLTLASVAITYNEITNTQLLETESPQKIIILIIFDLILFLVLAVLLSRKIFRLWHKGSYQSGRIQNKIILTFSLVAAVPTIIVTVFSTIFFNFSIHSWFDHRVGTAINESVVVAESYFKVQWKLIESDVNIMAQDLNYLAPDISYGPQRLANYLSKQAEDKMLLEAVVFQTEPKTKIAQSRYNFSDPFETISEHAVNEANHGNIVVIQGDDDNKVRALIKLNFIPNCYLLVGRAIDTKILDHVINTKGAASEYARLKGQVSNLQIKFLIIFIVVSLLLVFIAIWLGITFSSTLIKPLNHLVSATEQISEGDFDINIRTNDKNDEISVLSRAFNSMAQELSSQRQKLIEAALEIKARHHFSETVLSGVSAGVVALGLNRHISTINPTALNILSIDRNEKLNNKNFYELCPEIASLLNHANDFIGHEVKKEIVINRNNKSIILIVRIMAEEFLNKTTGYIITFDDITPLVLAQRSAAWSDIARKIAHEIKNPLTPIHLAAERLRKKYSSEVDDQKNFDKYIEIIVKHVKDIGTMVEEFVQLA